MKKETASTVSSSELTANEFVNVKDIKGNYLYTKDNYVIGYVRIYPFNKDLLSTEELRAKTRQLTARFESDRKDFSYFAFQREIDLDGQKKQLEQMYTSEMASVGTRHLLRIMIDELNRLSTSGQNYEHQHYIKLWERYTNANKTETEAELKIRLQDFRGRYENAGIQTDILDQQDIIKLCSLFASAAQAPFQRMCPNMRYEPQVRLRG